MIIAINGTNSFLIIEEELVEVNGDISSLMHIKRVNPLRGQIPYGFDINEFNELIANPEEQAVIRNISDLHAEGKSLRSIADWLSENCIQTKNNGKWQANSVKKILSRC